MPCTERRVGPRLVALVVVSAIAGCSTPPSPPPVVTRPTAPTPPAAPVPATPTARGLPAPNAVRNWNEVRAQAAMRLVAANPGLTYSGVVPDILLAIPVLEVELNGDGSIRRIEVLRVPRQAKDTVQLAIDAVHRAAPFGDVSRLPRPWKFAETFLFNDDRKFKPRTLDP